MSSKNHYSPIWQRRYKGRGISPKSIKFEDGDRLKHCPRCDEWLPADTEFFNIAKCQLVGLSSYCRCCNTEIQNEKKYWLKAS